MTYKTLLFPLGSDCANDHVSKLIKACDLDETHKVMLLLQVAPSLPMAVEVPLTDQWISEMNSSREQARASGRALEETLKNAGLEAEVQAVLCERPEIETVTSTRARYADLTVLSWSHFGDKDVFNRTLNGLLFQSGKPALVISGETQVTGALLQPQTVLIAWDGGLPVSRAVGAAIDILRGARNVHIVCVDPKAIETDDGEAPGWDLASYLTRHDVSVTVSQLSGGGLSVDAVLARHAIEIGAELIVMGGYGHSRLREKLLGGTTQAMVEHSQLPILMAH